MPSRPPETEFYDDPLNYTLWRDISRIFEDWAPIDASERNDRFKTVMSDILDRLDESESEQ